MAEREPRRSALDSRQQRLAGMLVEVEGRPLLSMLIRIPLWGLAQWLRVERFIRRRLKRETRRVLPSAVTPPLMIAGKPRVLLIVEDRLPQCYRYRVEQKREQLSIHGMTVKVIPWVQAVHDCDDLYFHHIVIFYRVPGYDNVLDLINTARNLGKIVIYETDDVIFDADIQRDTIESSYRQISSKLRRQLLRGAVFYRRAMAACDWGLASTPALAEQMEKVLGKDRVLIHANGIDSLIQRVAAETTSPASSQIPAPSLERADIRIFYGSGTKTHDADLELIAGPLATVLERFPSARLTLVGYISLPTRLEAHRTRVDQLPLLETEIYLQMLGRADIAIAPLVPGVFADCKSEIKWLEAALLGVPSVVSATRSFADAISDGVDGMLADGDDEWERKLGALIADKRLRHSMAEAAKHKVVAHYAPAILGERLAGQLAQLAAKAGAVMFDPKSQPGVCVVGEETDTDTIIESNDGGDIHWMILEVGAQSDMLVTWRRNQGIDLARLAVDADGIELKSVVARVLDYANPRLLMVSKPDKLGLAVSEVAIERDIPFVIRASGCGWLGGDETGDCFGASVSMDPIGLAINSADAGRWLNEWNRRRRILEHVSAIFVSSSIILDSFRNTDFDCELMEPVGLQKALLAVINRAKPNG